MKNRYEVRGDTTVIFINSPKYGNVETIIATDSLLRVREFPNSWRVWWREDIQNFYVMGTMRDASGRARTVLLHRWVMGVEDSCQQVDHVLHDTLDNCWWSLRVVRSADNQQNLRKFSTNTSGHVGVIWYKPYAKWRAQISVGNRCKALGYFERIDDAIAARKAAEEIYFTYKRSIS